jgi:uncharacterized RDD family membrane protein YckC
MTLRNRNILYSARSWRRLSAYFVDQFILNVFLGPFYLGFFKQILSVGVVKINFVHVLAYFMVQFFYFACFYYFFSATPGKWLFGLRLINNNTGDEPTLSQVFLRVLSEFLLGVFGMTFRSLALFRLDRRHVSDWIAETRVVQVYPRLLPPSRRWFIGLIMFLYFFFTSFGAQYSLIQKSQLNGTELEISNFLCAPLGLIDCDQSGHNSGSDNETI